MQQHSYHGEKCDMPVEAVHRGDSFDGFLDKELDQARFIVRAMLSSNCGSVLAAWHEDVVYYRCS